MRFQVPQFIEVESKIFGPLTLKQFIFLAGGGGIIFILYAILPFWLMIIFGIPFGILAFALAFYKVNEQPFIKVMESAFNFLLSAKIYVWKKTPPEKKIVKEIKKEDAKGEEEIYVPKLTESKLKDLAWSLNIKEKIK